MMTAEEHRKINHDLCVSVDLTRLGVVLDRLIAHGLSVYVAQQYRNSASALLALVWSENDRLRVAGPHPTPTTPEADRE